MGMVRWTNPSNHALRACTNTVRRCRTVVILDRCDSILQYALLYVDRAVAVRTAITDGCAYADRVRIDARMVLPSVTHMLASELHSICADTRTRVCSST